jgi:hypothetical protein
MRKVFLVTISLVLFFGILLYMRGSSDIRGIESKDGVDIMGEEISSVKRIAICPTMDRVISKEIVYDEYFFVNVDSTSEAVLLLNNGEVDYVISGRIPSAEEGIGEYLHLYDGLDRFSFLSNIREFVYTLELNSYPIYTDLEEGILEDMFSLNDINYVEDVYEYLDEGIVVTTWQNTDYTKGSLVHIMDSGTSRNIFSRLPTLFCKTECLEEDFLKLTELFKI